MLGVLGDEQATVTGYNGAVGGARLAVPLWSNGKCCEDWRPTCMCLQSWPRAGSWILRKVMGHLRDTLMAVCSTPSSPFGPGVPGIVPLLKFRLTRGWEREATRLVEGGRSQSAGWWAKQTQEAETWR